MNPNTQSLCKAAGIGWHEAAESSVLADTLAQLIARSLQEQIDSDGAASLVVSGGSTPAPVFERLSGIDIDWSKVAVTLADERWVPPGHADSNESLVRDLLLVNKAKPAQFVSLYRQGVSADDAVSSVAADIAAMAQPFSVCILGMGSDGHTASLFPDAAAEQLDAAMSTSNPQSVAILRPPSVTQERITLTRSALLNSHQRILHITGQVKHDVLAEALAQSAGQTDIPGEYTAGMKPIVGLLTTEPAQASVYWSP